MNNRVRRCAADDISGADASADNVVGTGSGIDRTERVLEVACASIGPIEGECHAASSDIAVVVALCEASVDGLRGKGSNVGISRAIHVVFDTVLVQDKHVVNIGTGGIGAGIQRWQWR